jgi:membrane protease YdiL (CAAX protease family)
MGIQKFFIQTGLFLLLGLFTYGFTKWKIFKLNSIRIEEPGKSSLAAALSIAFGIGLVVLIFLALGSSGGQEIDDEAVRYSLSTVFSQAVVALIMVGPAMLVLRSRKESWASVGAGRQNLCGSILLGLILGGLTVGISMIEFGTGSAPMKAVTLSAAFWGFLHFAVVGFAEEFAFRGYLQTRLSALLGAIPGWLLASVLMASVHIFQRILIMGLPSGEALLDSLSLIPFSLLMGYIMMRTENIMAPGIFHSFANWIGIFY